MIHAFERLGFERQFAWKDLFMTAEGETLDMIVLVNYLKTTGGDILMTVTIAVAGKGGTGKTTLSGLLVRYLVSHRGGKILAIDADPSSNLHLVLDMKLSQTIGDIREEARDWRDARHRPGRTF